MDHVEPLKQHWRTRGSAMSLDARSTEANHRRNLVGACATCNRSKGARLLRTNGWWPGAWGATWWAFGPLRVTADNTPPPYW